MATEQQLRNVRMACLFGDEFRQSENTNAPGPEADASIIDILRPGLEAQRAQVIANLNGEGDSQPVVPKNMNCKEDMVSQGSAEEMASIASIYDFIDKEYDCIQQYSGASTCTESTQDLFRGRSSTGTRSAYTDTYSTTSCTSGRWAIELTIGSALHLCTQRPDRQQPASDLGGSRLSPT